MHQTIRCHACSQWCPQHPLTLKWHWCNQCNDHIIHDEYPKHLVAHRAERAGGADMAPGEYQEAYGK
jgi:hypothetical protein